MILFARLDALTAVEKLDGRTNSYHQHTKAPRKTDEVSRFLFAFLGALVVNFWVNGQGFRKRSTNRSLVPRRSPAARGESFQSRVSSLLRRKSACPSSTNPAARTSDLTTFSSIR